MYCINYHLRESQIRRMSNLYYKYYHDSYEYINELFTYRLHGGSLMLMNCYVYNMGWKLVWTYSRYWYYQLSNINFYFKTDIFFEKKKSNFYTICNIVDKYN